MDIVQRLSKRRFQNSPGCLSLLWSNGVGGKEHGNTDQSCEQAYQTDQHRWTKSKYFFIFIYINLIATCALIFVLV